MLKSWKVLAASALVLLMGFVFFFVWRSRNVDSSNAIILPSNEKVSLGQSVDSLKKIPGVFEIDNKHYQYPSLSKGSKPVEAVMYVEQRRVVALKILRASVRLTGTNEVDVGMRTSDLKTKLGKALKPQYRVLKVGVAQGYYLDQGKSNTYFLIDPCKAKIETVLTIGVVLKGYEDKIIGLGTGCSGHGN